ncbi:hypothetical protein [Allokutzneria oryzae]|uniref:Uncharacterized protein n=1 Tax=Allokutzneria oryzae TaxID=1378989 RepID=A0ABV5ZSL4_9PSEU
MKKLVSAGQTGRTEIAPRGGALSRQAGPRNSQHVLEWTNVVRDSQGHVWLFRTQCERLGATSPEPSPRRARVVLASTNSRPWRGAIESTGLTAILGTWLAVLCRRRHGGANGLAAVPGLAMQGALQLGPALGGPFVKGLDSKGKSRKRGAERGKRPTGFFRRLLQAGRVTSTTFDFQ